MARKKSPAWSGRAGKARCNVGDLPVLINHRLVADKRGDTPDRIREWVAKGSFPVPHSLFEQSLLYRVDLIRAFLETGRWPEGTRFFGKRGNRVADHGGS